jgi:Retroviral aspartyl protease
MPSFPYTKVEGRSSIPILNIYLHNPINHQLSTNFDFAILDTGSDITIISYEIVSKLQLRPIGSQKYTSFRGLGRETQGIPYLINLSFDNRDYISSKVIAVPDDILQGEAIIGRNILNRYAITFNGPKLVFTIE